jgi:hypothetical protein
MFNAPKVYLTKQRAEQLKPQLLSQGIFAYGYSSVLRTETICSYQFCNKYQGERNKIDHYLSKLPSIGAG